MKLHLFWYECKNCKTIFKSPELSGDVYGEFLLRSKIGEIAYLNAMHDPVFQLISDYIKNYPSACNMQPIDRSELLHAIFGVTCDVDSNGSDFSMILKSPCPNCKKSNIGHWGPTNPPEFLEEEIPSVTHNQWNKLIISEKEQKIKKALDAILASK